MSFKKDKYQVIKGAISTELADFCYQYFLNKRAVARHLFDDKYISQFTDYFGVWNDQQIPETYSHYSDIVMETLLQKVKPVMEKESGIKVAIPRLFNIYGPRQIGSGAIHEFIKNSINNKALTLYNDGSQIRAWCYIDDCINALHIITKKGNGIFNIGNPYESLSTTSLANLILDITKSKSKLIFKKLNTTDIRLRVPNIEKLSKLGYHPKFPIRMGLTNTFEWYSNSLKINP